MCYLLRDAGHGHPIRVTGDGTPQRSCLYASDLAIWLWTVLLAGAADRAYNVGSPDSVSIADLARAVALASGEPLPVQIAGTSVPGRPLDRYVPAVRRAETELGLQVWIPLPEALRRTFAWQRSMKPVSP